MLEAEVLQRVRAIFDQIANPEDLLVPNGDDGAVIAAGDKKIVLSTDMAVEGVHFNLQWSNPQQIGRKITAANLADICAMGGWPKYLLVALAFPKTFLPHLEDLAKGIVEEAKKVGAKVIGGDISTGEKVVISITAYGEAQKVLTRSAAQLGDLVLVSNLPGWSAAGLQLLQSGEVEKEISKKAVGQHLAPEIEYQKYRAAFESAHAATDISDGLLLDALNIGTASRLGIKLNSQLIKQTPQFLELQRVGERFNSFASNFDSMAMEWVLTGGEDHELLITAANEVNGYLAIGHVVAETGVWIDEKKLTTEEMGFAHQW